MEYPTITIYQLQLRYHLQCRYVCRGDTAILQVAGRRRCAELVEASAFDAGGDIVLCMTQLNLSAHVYHRILKLARTMADLAGSGEVQSVYLAEALQYRPKLMVG